MNLNMKKGRERKKPKLRGEKKKEGRKEGMEEEKSFKTSRPKAWSAIPFSYFSLSA